jgi:hypothetical protein
MGAADCPDFFDDKLFVFRDFHKLDERRVGSFVFLPHFFKQKTPGAKRTEGS